jgi:ribose 5-phosphate isomerase B
MRPRVLIASDHAGFKLKQALQKSLTDWEWIDLGPNDPARVDYPDYAEALARKLVAGEASQGILICGSGIGMSIAANKVPGIRAAVVENPIAAQLAREHNNANVLCLGARFTAAEYATEIAATWLESTYDPESGGGRHQVRIEKISKLET